MRIPIVIMLTLAGCGGSPAKKPPQALCPGTLSATSDIISVLPNHQCIVSTVPFLSIEGEGPNGNDASVTITTNVTPTPGTYSCASGKTYIMASDPSQMVSGQEDSWSAGISDPPTGSCTLTLDIVSDTHVSGNMSATVQDGLSVVAGTVDYKVDFSLDVTE